MIRWKFDLFFIIIFASLHLNSSYANNIDAFYEEKDSDEGVEDDTKPEREDARPLSDSSAAVLINKIESEKFEQVILSQGCYAK